VAGPARWRYPAILILLLGGVSGAALALGSTLFLAQGMGWDPRAAFFLGTLLNQGFHFVYYRVIHVNPEIQLRTPLPTHFLLSLAVSGLSAGLLGALLPVTGGLVPSLLAALAILSLVNLLVNRISTFSSSSLASVEYRGMNESYYDDHVDQAKVGRFKAWYHGSRFDRLAEHVGQWYRKGMKVADLGCGNCRWNLAGLPVTGVDINEGMLRWAKKQGRLKDFRARPDLSRTGLPTRGFHLVVMSEVLEHVLDHRAVLGEVRRILKDDGNFLITVPYDFFLGPFFVLFNLNCLYMGYVKGSRYHRFRCGHVHHFTKTRLRETLRRNGFLLTQVRVVNGLLLYASARKDPAWSAEPRLSSRSARN